MGFCRGQEGAMTLGKVGSGDEIRVKDHSVLTLFL